MSPSGKLQSNEGAMRLDCVRPRSSWLRLNLTPMYPVGGTPVGGITFDGTNIWVTNWGSNSVTKINPAVQNTGTLSATNLTFGNQAVGLTSAPQSVTVANSGNAALNITSISITGTNSADYAQTNTCGNSVAAASSCTISVTFTPTATGTRTALVSV